MSPLVLLVLVAGMASAAEESAQPEAAPAPAAEPPPETSPPAPQASPPAPEASPPAPEATPPAPEPSPPPKSPHGSVLDFNGIGLPGDFRLHGRFDINYERVGYSDNPLDGKDALQNYHHFLFVVRDVKDDPITFNVELINLNWYEIAYRYHPAGAPWRIRAKAGKFLVPFGPEPLFHHTYGGRAGFDQQLLSVVWSQLGGTVNVQVDLGHGVAVSNDIYAVQGYALSAPDAILNLQSDFSNSRDIRFGFGDRLSVSYGPITAYYSAYYNELGFGRRLFMQALDVSLWRVYGVPFLDRFTLDAGVVRADVSGGESRGYGGPGEDYYHFADYLQLRYYPLDWLYVQLRTGIKNINNRRGLTGDDTRFDQNDTISHNIGVVGRYRNLTMAVYHFWNLERRNEIPNDLLRFAVIYEF